jgi:hypothetical protein
MDRAIWAVPNLSNAHRIDLHIGIAPQHYVLVAAPF